MKILVTGGSGVIGSNLVETLLKSENIVHYTFHSHECVLGKTSVGHRLDVSNRENTMELINRIKPELTIHASALTNMDLCETDKQLAYNVNVEGTRNVIDGCRLANSKVIYVSTSNVFDGTKKIYSESDIPNAINNYGATKLEGERMIQESNLSFLILRTDQPYCWVKPWQRKNSVIRVLEKLESNEVVNDVLDWYNTPTLVDNFSEVTVTLIKEHKSGIYHVVGSQFVNRYEWGLKIAEVFNKDQNLIQPIMSSQLNVFAKRANVHLSNKRTTDETEIKLLDIAEGLYVMKAQRGY